MVAFFTNLNLVDSKIALFRVQIYLHDYKCFTLNRSLIVQCHMLVKAIKGMPNDRKKRQFSLPNTAFYRVKAY